MTGGGINRLNALWVVGVLLLLVSPVRADQASDTTGAAAPAVPFQTCVKDVVCYRFYQSGRGFAQLQQYDEALAAYTSAYERIRTPLLLLNIGRMHQKSGRMEQAIASYQAFLLVPLHPSDSVGREAARKYLEEAGTALADKHPAPALRLQDPPTPAALRSDPGRRLDRPTPVYKKWWFWTIAGGAVLAGVGAGIAIAATTGPRYPEPGLHPF